MTEGRKLVKVENTDSDWRPETMVQSMVHHALTLSSGHGAGV